MQSLTATEHEHLEISLQAEGCRDSLVVWDNTIVDGHNRHDICTRLGIPYTTHAIDFDSHDDAKAWIIRNQFARRNLTAFQRVELALKLKPLITVGQGARTELRPNSDKVDTKNELAKIAGVRTKNS